MRRFGERVVSGQAYRRRPGAYGVLLRDGAILLTHQAEPVPEYQLPGGGIDPGEGPVEALHREVYEETGWAIAAPRRVGVYKRFVWMPEYRFFAEKICHVYVARPVLRRGEPTEPGHRAVWAEARAAMALVQAPGERLFLGRVLRDAGLI